MNIPIQNEVKNKKRINYKTINELQILGTKLTQKQNFEMSYGINYLINVIRHHCFMTLMN